MATKTLNIALDEKLLKQIDKVANQDMASRSEYFKRLVLKDISRRQQWSEVLDAGNKKGRVKGFGSEKEIYALLED